MMNELPVSSSQGRNDLISQITLEVYEDPALAGDGHVYKRNTINQWIETQGTSPITGQSLSIDDLQSKDVQPVTYSIESFASPRSSPSIYDTDGHHDRKTTLKETCISKRMILIVL